MEKTSYIIGLDIGTTSTKGILYRMPVEGIRSSGAAPKDGCPKVIAGSDCLDVHTETHTRSLGRHGSVEQDPDEVLGAVVRVVRTLVSRNGVVPSRVSALSFGGTLHSLLPVDRDGEALSPALLWADLRSVKQSEHIRASVDQAEVMERTGCPIHPLYFPSRLRWFREEAPGLAKHAFKFVSIKEYVLHKLFGRWIVDRSTASGTGMWNMSTMDWDDFMLEVAGFDRERFSEVVDTTTVLAGLASGLSAQMGLSGDIRGVIGASDGPQSHLASIGFDENRISMSVGTSAALRRRVRRPMVLRGSGTWCYYLMENYWLLGGVIHDAGFVMDWFSDAFLASPAGPPAPHALRAETREAPLFEELDALVREVPPGSEGIRFLPFLVGEQCPTYNPKARAAILGMSFVHGRKHLVRAMLEGIAYRLNSVYSILSAGDDLDLVVSGGILKSPAWMELTADFLGRRLWKPAVPMAAAWGAVLLALKALGLARTDGELGALSGAGECVEWNREVHDFYVGLRKEYDRYYEKLFRE
jgi:gluconokinase